MRRTLMSQLRDQWIGVAVGMLALFVALDGPVVASDAVSSAKHLITGTEIKDGTISTKDLSKSTVKALRGATGPRGLSGTQGLPGVQGLPGAKGDQGGAGPSGNDATPAEIVGKVTQADGAGSGIDADLLDGINGTAFALLANTVSDGDTAGGDLSGPYPNPQIGSGVVGQPEIATNGVAASELANGSVGRSELSSGGQPIGTTEDQGAIAGHSCVYFSRSVSGADHGEMAIPIVSETASHTTLADGLYYTPTVVTTTDVVPLTLCNYTANAIDTPPYLLDYALVGL